MDILLAILTGLIYSVAIYLLLHKGMVKMILGIMMLGYATNLFIFIIARITRGLPALIPENADSFLQAYADPVPQALILTAIVIGFGIQTFAIVLIRMVYKTTGTSDMDKLSSTDKID
ncbi:MAG TPA: Na+/H+ antiporter subunit C [Tenuifilaceae bacterium]|nr:Na+/H+ antiporter subunit C [Tenuifilaceae bacterium]HPJ45807.1 Na+/H+ antiporter subunit C [Tenuifilaceae bacterium]HRX66845.1 Na+/H+ antiporter subunit C [Tenuifilaceae bacterium]